MASSSITVPAQIIIGNHICVIRTHLVIDAGADLLLVGNTSCSGETRLTMR